MVCNAVSEMRRYYSRKVIDVLIKVTRYSLDVLRKQFQVELGILLFFSFCLCKANKHKKDWKISLTFIYFILYNLYYLYFYDIALNVILNE